MDVAHNEDAGFLHAAGEMSRESVDPELAEARREVGFGGFFEAKGRCRNHCGLAFIIAGLNLGVSPKRTHLAAIHLHSRLRGSLSVPYRRRAKRRVPHFAPTLKVD